MADELGRGLYLDEQLDLDVDTTGDIRSTTGGSNELEKDLAFQLILVTQDLIGQRASKEVKVLLKDRAIGVAQSDTRVRAVNKGAVDVQQTGRESYSVTMSVVTQDGEQELVFEL